MGHIGAGDAVWSRVYVCVCICASRYLLRNHCHAHWCARRRRPFNIRKRGSTRLAVAVKHGLQSSQYSPGTAASVMARPGTLCIATVTVLVILAAAVQPGEHYLTASICTCTYTQWFVSVQIAYKMKQLVTLKFVFLLHCVVLFFISSWERPQ